MEFDTLLKNYASLAVKIGVNVQPGQTLIVNSPIECSTFTREVCKVAYEEGAKEVVVHWNDEITTKLKYQYCEESVLEVYPEWMTQSYMHYINQGAAILTISASDPELLKDVPSSKIAKAQKARQLGLVDFYKKTMSNEVQWSIVSIPTVGWATKIFPNLPKEDAVQKLWDSIFNIVRLQNDNHIEAWNSHKSALKQKLDFLNQHNFEYIQLRNKLGTDVTIGLVEDHIWAGGSEFSTSGVEFMANIPTEEVFTMPHKFKTNGVVFSAKPLNYGGNLIDNFSLTFKDGKVVDFSAEKGADILKTLIETDEGSHYLGEIALVPFDSPISNTGLLFYNTLFDENASCHLAIGGAYPINIKDGTTLAKDQYDSYGMNDSLTHVDFMIGTEDMDITGITKDHKEVKLFTNGNWAF